ncbi:MAG: sulfotransferase family protein [Planctomycetes bacterium]|nr:sulfotransferase family protein [Planctomycetota bacterium]
MAPFAPGTPFDLVHVGKCGGSSIAAELRSRGHCFEHVHLRRPLPRPGHRYVVLVRDPVARFVSAFNWRRYLFDADQLPAARQEDPVARLRHRAEREFLSEFSDVGGLAERLERTGPEEVSPVSALMSLIGQVPQGFAWYLDGLLDTIDPTQIAAVIATERLTDDCERAFGFRPTLTRNGGYPTRGGGLSPAGRANLAREFAAEYRTLNRLGEIAAQGGAAMSVHYDPVRGAVPS